jgi:hypothetical protein
MMYRLRTGLPDGLFSNQKSQFGYIFEVENVDIFMAIWNILRTFGHMSIWYIFTALVSRTKKTLATLIAISIIVF